MHSWEKRYCTVEGVQSGIYVVGGMLDHRNVTHQDGGEFVDNESLLVVDVGEWIPFLFIIRKTHSIPCIVVAGINSCCCSKAGESLF